jgi:hypothetical protein
LSIAIIPFRSCRNRHKKTRSRRVTKSTPPRW